MKIHRLTFHGIGPYDDTHTIDFDKLGASNIFVIEGDTGSGKSIIIDAIVLALYGRTAADSSKANGRIRCLYLPDNDNAYATVDFESAGKNYRVKRIPAQTTNSGVNRKGSASIWRLDYPGQETPPADAYLHGLRDVSIEVARIIGLSIDQFLQTVVLPQGRFTKFLQANSDERQKILETIFHTQHYSLFEQRIKERASELNKHDEQLRHDIATHADEYGQLLTDMDIDDRTTLVDNLGRLSDNPSRDALTTITTPVTQTLDTRSACAQKHRDELADRATQAQSALNEAKTLRDNKADYAKAVSDKDKLDQRTDDIDKLRLALQQHHKASFVDKRYGDLKESVRHLDDLYEAINGDIVTVPDEKRHIVVTPDFDISTLWRVDPDLVAAKRHVIDNNAKLLGQLEHAKEIETKQHELRHQIAQAKKEADDALATKKTYEEQRAGFPDAISAWKEKRQKAVADRDTLEQLRRAAEDDLQRVSSAKTWLKKNEQLVCAHKVRDVAEKTLKEKIRAEGRALELYTAGAAGILASFLEDDAACPVCGSHDHPALARTDNKDSIDYDAYMAVREEREQAANKQATAKANCDALDKECHDLAADFDDRSAQQIIDDDTARREQMTKLGAPHQVLDDIDTKIEELTAKDNTLEAKITELSTTLSTLSAQCETWEKQVKENDEELTKAQGDFTSVTARYNHVLDTNTSLNCFIDKTQQLASQLRTIEDLYQLVEKEVSDQGFDSINQALSALLSDSEEKQQTVTRYDTELSVVMSRLEDEKLRQAASCPDPDIPALEQAATTASAAADEARDAYATLVARRETLARHEANLCHAVDDYEDLRRQQLPLWNINRAVNAKGAEKVSLATWVLQGRLDQIIALANPMVEDLSDGRFRLVRTAGDGGQKNNQGLSVGIDSVDAEGNRNVETISGGESFYSSLALALALSKVVSLEAGGITIDTMFIDEGFGTLDRDKLDRVLQELKSPDYAQRTIGIISHVDAVRERFAERISVTRKKDGKTSTLRVIS